MDVGALSKGERGGPGVRTGVEAPGHRQVRPECHDVLRFKERRRHERRRVDVAALPEKRVDRVEVQVVVSVSIDRGLESPVHRRCGILRDGEGAGEQHGGEGGGDGEHHGAGVNVAAVAVVCCSGGGGVLCTTLLGLGLVLHTCS